MLTRRTTNAPTATTRDAAGLAPHRSAQRQSRPRWSDARIWAAAGLLAVAALLGGVVVGRGGDTVQVLAASGDLSAGASVLDLVPVAVPSTIADRYLAADADVAGVLRWPVMAGELVPASALMDSVVEPTRLVSIPVDPLHAPADLGAGDLVDVWVTPRPDVGAVGAGESPALVLTDVVVTSVVTDGAGFAGGWGVELAVPESAVERMVSAGRGGVLDLVTVPPMSQSVLP